MVSKQKIAAVADIGTTKIAALAGIKTDNGLMDILGYASVESKGVKRGTVINPGELVNVLDEVIFKLEEQFDGRIGELNIALSGTQFRSLISKVNKYTSDDRIVTKESVEDLWREALKYPCGNGQKIYHIFPVDYVIDEEPGNLNPVGIKGEKIEGIFHLLAAPDSYQKNIETALKPIRLKLTKTVFSSIALAETVLNDDEKEAGVVLVDIGGGTTKLAIYYEGVLVHCSVIPFGGNVITNDIKEGCSILYRWAEKLKVRYGQAMGDFAEKERIVTIPGYNGWEPKEISFKELAYIIQARLEEILDNVYLQIENSGYLDKLGAGIVLTGGTSNLQNIVSLVRYRTGLDARIGKSNINIKNKNVELETSNFYTVLGLLKLTLDETLNIQFVTENVKKRKQKAFFWNKVKEQVAEQITMIFDEDDIEMK